MIRARSAVEEDRATVLLLVLASLASSCQPDASDATTRDEALLANEAGITRLLDADLLEAPLDAGDAGDAGDAAVPDGSFAVIGAFESAPVIARPVPGRDDAVQIERYPERVTVRLGHGLLPVGYEGAFSSAYCAEIRRIAEQSKLGEPLRTQALRILRRSGSPVARIPLTPLVSPRFEADVLRSARAQGFTLSAAHLENPLVAREASIDLMLREGAISAILGIGSTVDALVATLRAQRAHALRGGDLTLAIAGKDVWCDLASDAASLVIEVRGEARGTPVHTTTFSRRVEPR